MRDGQDPYVLAICFINDGVRKAGNELPSDCTFEWRTGKRRLCHKRDHVFYRSNEPAREAATPRFIERGGRHEIVFRLPNHLDAR